MGWERELGLLIKLDRTMLVRIVGHITTPTITQPQKWYNDSVIKGFQFAIGDVITIRVDFQNSKAIFIKNNSVSYEQPIKLDLGPIYAFAGPTNLNDVLAIL